MKLLFNKRNQLNKNCKNTSPSQQKRITRFATNLKTKFHFVTKVIKNEIQSAINKSDDININSVPSSDDNTDLVMKMMPHFMYISPNKKIKTVITLCFRQHDFK